MSETPKTYDEEQEKLRREVDGDETNITPPEPFPEVNPEVWQDVEPLLFRGFLTQAADINDVPFVFKSINHRELDLIGFLVGRELHKPSKIQAYYDTFLSYGVLMVDGQNVLGDRDRWIQELSKFFTTLPAGAKQKVVRYLSEINRRATRAVHLTEAFVFEPVSRLRWAQLKDLDMTSTAVTGISGSGQLGMNWGQLTWRALNYYEDLRIQAETDWENAKFIASAMAGKGMSKIYSQDRSRRDKEREDKVKRRDKVLRFALLGEPLDSAGPIDGAKVFVAETVSELTDQLKADLKGEKDWHDQVIEAHERRVRDQYEEKSRRLQEIWQKHEEESGGRQVSGGTDLRGLSAQEVQERLLRRRQLEAQSAASQIVYPELYDERYSEFMDKWSLPGVKVGQTDRDPSSAIPLPEARPKGTPWRGRK